MTQINSTLNGSLPNPKKVIGPGFHVVDQMAARFIDQTPSISRINHAQFAADFPA